MGLCLPHPVYVLPASHQLIEILGSQLLRVLFQEGKKLKAMFSLLRPGIQWKALPRSLGAASTVHDRFQEWRRAGVFQKLWTANLLEYEVCQRLGWEWQSLDSAMTKAPLGGEATGPNPTDRGKCGTKRHVMTEASGPPIAVVITGANRHDKTQVETVLDAITTVGGLSQVSSKKIWIARPVPGNVGCDQHLPVDWDAIARGASTATNYQLMPGDRVFIAENDTIALTGFIGELIGPIERVAGSLSLGTNTVRNTQTLGRSYNQNFRR